MGEIARVNAEETRSPAIHRYSSVYDDKLFCRTIHHIYVNCQRFVFNDSRGNMNVFLQFRKEYVIILVSYMGNCVQ